MKMFLAHVFRERLPVQFLNGKSFNGMTFLVLFSEMKCIHNAFTFQLIYHGICSIDFSLAAYKFIFIFI